MPVSPLLHVYTIVHFALSFLVADFISASAKVLISKNLKLFDYVDEFQTSSQGALLVTILYCLWGLTNIGLLYDQAALAWPSELARCLITLLMFSTLAPVYTVMVSGTFVYNVFTASTLICIAMLINSKTKEKIF